MTTSFLGEVQAQATAVNIEQIGNYQILGELGKGGMGVVYRARHVASEQAVALKTVKGDTTRSAHWLEGLRREIYALTRIRHPGVVRIVDHGVHQGLPWYAMDLLEGERLEDFCRRVWSPYRWTSLADDSMGLPRTNAVYSEALDGGGEPARSSSTPPPTPGGKPPAAAGQLKTVLQLMRRVCATLAYLHGEGFINCDLTPRNIVLVAGEPVIIDFGLTAQHPGSSREASESPHAFGTLPYMSPEQVRGELVDARSDLYSIGCLLYELVTGRPPFLGAYRSSFLTQHASSRPLPPSELAIGIPPELERLMLRLLEKDLSARFGHADEVAVALAELGDDARRLPNFPPARPYLYRSRLVGREQVMSQLVDLRARAIRGTGAMVFIGGESGVGKTRVALELARLEPGARLQVVTSEASPLAAQDGETLTQSPLQALRPLLRAIADRCHEGGPEVTERLLGERRALLARFEPLLADVPSFAPISADVTLTEHGARQRLFRCLADTIAFFAMDQPVLWLLDDLGWADELSLAFLRTLTAEYIANVPLLLLATYRSEEPNDDVQALATQPHSTHLLLSPLDQSAVANMIEEMLALRRVPEDFLEFVVERGDGNPFFIAEYLRAAVGERVLYRGEQNTWQLRPRRGSSEAEFQGLSLPRSLQSLLERRLRVLTPAATQTLLAAATLGRDIELDLLDGVADIEPEIVLGAVDELLRCQILEQNSGRIRFAHDQLRTVAYARISPEARRVLHARAAKAVEASSDDPKQASELWITLGHHFERAGQPEAAVGYLQRAAAHAHKTYAIQQAIELYRRAIHLMGELPERDSNALAAQQEALGDVLAINSQRGEARLAYESATVAVAASATVPRARLQRKLGKTWEAEHRHEQALTCYAGCRQLLDGHDLRRDVAVRDEWIQVHVEELWVHYWLNRVSDMEATVAKVSPIMSEGGSPLQRSKFLHAQAMKNLRRDRYVVVDETLELSRQTLQACTSGNAVSELPMAQFFFGMCLLFHGSLDQAAIELQRGLELARRGAEIAQQARCMTYVTVLARRRRQLDQAEDVAAKALELSLRSELREYVAAAWANQAWVALRRGELDRACELATQAVQSWQQFPAVFPFHWLARLPLLELAIRRDQLADACEHADAILAPTQHAFHRPGLALIGEAAQKFRSGDTVESKRAFDSALNELRERAYA